MGGTLRPAFRRQEHFLAEQCVGGWPGGQPEGFDEVVLLNERGEVAECTSANIFVVKNGKVLTPPLNAGCLEGVTRGILMEIAPGAGRLVAEQSLHPEDLYSADEMFISSTNRNVIGVGEIAGHAIANSPGPVTGVSGNSSKRTSMRYVSVACPRLRASVGPPRSARNKRNHL